MHIHTLSATSDKSQEARLTPRSLRIGTKASSLPLRAHRGGWICQPLEITSNEIHCGRQGASWHFPWRQASPQENEAKLIREQPLNHSCHIGSSRQCVASHVLATEAGRRTYSNQYTSKHNVATWALRAVAVRCQALLTYRSWTYNVLKSTYCNRNNRKKFAN